jgi:hypothetical protein
MGSGFGGKNSFLKLKAERLKQKAFCFGLSALIYLLVIIAAENMALSTRPTTPLVYRVYKRPSCMVTFCRRANSLVVPVL